MRTIEYPTKDSIMNFADGTIYVKADDDSVNQYCTEKGYTLIEYIPESQRFSNNGALPYQYYKDSTWFTEFGFERVVQYLLIS